MNTNFRRFKTLDLRIMAGDALKVDVNNATSIFREFLWRFACVWICTTEISIVYNTRTVEIAIKHFTSSFCRTTPYLSLHSDTVRVSAATSVASQLSKLRRNDKGSTGIQKTFRRDFGAHWYTPKMRLTQFGGRRYVMCLRSHWNWLFYAKTLHLSSIIIINNTILHSFW